MIVNQANLRALYIALNAAFQSGFAGAETYWNKIATPVPSTTSEEDYSWLGQFPSLREWIGDRQIKNLSLYGYTLKNKKFESTVGVPRDKIDDDQIGNFKMIFEDMGRAAAVHPDQLLFALMAAGFTSPCYDGQYFFDTDHPMAGGVASNFTDGGGSPWYLLDTSRPLKPFIWQTRRAYAFKALTSMDDEQVFMRDEYRYGVDARVNAGFGFWQMAYGSKDALDTDAYNDRVATMMGFKSDEGVPLGIKPRILMVGPSNRAAANTVIKALLINGGETNTNYNDVEVVVSPYLP